MSVNQKKPISISSSSSEEDANDISESVDPRFLGDGFVTVAVDDDREMFSQHGVLDELSSDEGAAESEDWADQELRQLREVIATPELSRNQRKTTLDGIEVAPRSDLSPPIQPTGYDPSAAVFNRNLKTKSVGKLAGVKLRKRFKDGNTLGRNSRSSQDLSGTMSKRGFSRKSRKHERKKSATGVFPEEGDDPSNLLKSGMTEVDLALAVDMMNSGITATTGTRKNVGTPDELFRHVVNEAIDSDEEAVHAYLFTLAYFTDPVRVLSDLITEHDLAEDAVDDENRKEASSYGAERIMRIISFWVSHLWYQFEGSDELMVLLNRFIDYSLKGKRWRQRLKDLITTMKKSRGSLHDLVDYILGFERASPLDDDVFGSIDASLGIDGDKKSGRFGKKKSSSFRNSRRDNGNEDEDTSSSSDQEADKERKQALAKTFVGAEAYTLRSKPMGLAELMMEDDALELSDKEEDLTIKLSVVVEEDEVELKHVIEIEDETEDEEEEESDSQEEKLMIEVDDEPNMDGKQDLKIEIPAEIVSETPPVSVISPKRHGDSLAGTAQYTESSRPMGLFGLVEDDEGTSSLWDQFKASDNWEIGNGDKKESDSNNFSREEVETHTPDQVCPSDIAKQLTLVEVYLWKLVSPLELQKVLWKNENESNGPNVKKVIDWHNRIAQWAQLEMISRDESERVNALKTLILVCIYLEKIQNFHTLFAVAGGMKVGSVSRLGVHLQLNSKWKKRYNHFVTLASTRDNWSEYRKVKEKATKFPFFPFLGLYLQDLQSLEAREKSFLGTNGAVVNFSKMIKLGTLLKEIVFIQRGTQYQFPIQPHTLSYLLSYQTLSENEIWDLSYDIKARSNSVAFTDANSPGTSLSESGAHFMTGVISPRRREPITSSTFASSSSSSGQIPTIPPGAVPMARTRSASISETFRKWQSTSKPLRKSLAESNSSSRLSTGPIDPSGEKLLGEEFDEYIAETTQTRQRQKSIGKRGSNIVVVGPKCPSCHKPFSSQSALVDHLLEPEWCGTVMVLDYSKPLQVNTCPVCGSAFETKPQLVEHLSTVCNSKLNDCPICADSFLHRKDLIDHLKSRVCH